MELAWIIPLLSALSLWAANWALMKLTFYPIRFIGIPPWLGWQGIIPRKAGIISDRLMVSLTSKLASVNEFMRVMNPARVAEHMIYSLRPRIGELLEDTILEHHPQLWDRLDDACKREITITLQRGLAGAIRAFMDGLTARTEYFVDLDALTWRQLTSRPRRVVKMLQEVGSHEFRFIVNAGLMFGIVVGILQMLAWLQLPAWWLLPVSGLFAGMLINWLALKMIFHPTRPRRIGPWTLHGLFLRRQEDIAHVACRLFSRKVISIENIMDAIFNGAHGDEAEALLRQRMVPLVAVALVDQRAAISREIGDDGYLAIKEALADALAGHSLISFDDSVFNHERQVAVEHTFLDRLLELSSEDFKELLRPSIREEEKLLVIAGGVLGMAAGSAIQFLLTLLQAGGLG